MAKLKIEDLAVESFAVTLEAQKPLFDTKPAPTDDGCTLFCTRLGLPC